MHLGAVQVRIRRSQLVKDLSLLLKLDILMFMERKQYTKLSILDFRQLIIQYVSMHTQYIFSFVLYRQELLLISSPAFKSLLNTLISYHLYIKCTTLSF